MFCALFLLITSSFSQETAPYDPTFGWENEFRKPGMLLRGAPVIASDQAMPYVLLSSPLSVVVYSLAGADELSVGLHGIAPIVAAGALAIARPMFYDRERNKREHIKHEFTLHLIQFCLDHRDSCRYRTRYIGEDTKTFVEIHNESHHVSFEIGIDPTVIETRMSPMTLRELKPLTPKIQTVLFDQAKVIGLEPARRFSGGHLHIGLESAFPRDDLALFRNFIVDFANHSEIYTGGLLYDPYAAEPLLKTVGNRAYFQSLLDDVDAGRIRTIHEFCKELLIEGLFKNRNIALNLQRVCKEDLPLSERTLEIRSIRASPTADYFERIVELFDSRLRLLRELTQKNIKIEYKGLGPILSRKQGVAQFHEYVTESNLEWDRFRTLLPLRWQDIEVKKTNAWKMNKSGVGPVLGCSLLLSAW